MTPPTTPSVSVVVATHDRPQRLAAMLESLRRQTIGDFEVIVVDDASGPATAELLAAECARAGLDLRTIRRERSTGPAAARNAGWRAARAPLVAFTDDDCEAAPGWLEAGLRAWEQRPDRVIQGQVQPIAAERDRLGAMTYTIVVAGPTPQFETANIFYPRDLLERLGGFDEAFGRPAGEDCDLGWRARELGAETTYCADARVEHAVVELTFAKMVRRLWQWSDAMRPYGRHPGLRAYLHLGLFWNWSHYLLLRALLALPLLRRRWGWALAAWLAGRYVAYEIEQSRKHAGTAWLAPLWVVRDVVETAACARGAVRYRVAVL